MPFEIRVPDLGESVLEATVGKWQKGVGDPVAAGDVLLDLETEKVNQEVTAEQSGVLISIARGDGATVGVGDVLGVLEMSGVAPSSAPSQAPAGNGAHAAAPAPAVPVAAVSPTPPASVAATPVAQRMAAQSGIDLAALHGSGPGGRITKQDVVSALPTAAPPVPPAPVQAPVPAPPGALPQALPAPAASSQREQRIRMSRRRQTIARRLVEAQQTAAMLTTFNEVDMTRIMDVRARRKDSFKERNGVNLGFMSFFTKASVGALKAFPRLNAEIQGDEIVLKQYYDIGIAVGAAEGLVVPVVRNADGKSFAQIEREIADLARRARDNALTLTELQGGTFTITNGGVFGSLLSTPILNTPQVGILGMHKIQQRPVAIDGQVVIRPMMYLALSYDHRIVDGSEAVSFLVRIKELLEDPESLLLEG